MSLDASVREGLCWERECTATIDPRSRKIIVYIPYISIPSILRLIRNACSSCVVLSQDFEDLPGVGSSA